MKEQGLDRQGLQGHQSDLSTGLPGIRQTQESAKTKVVPLPLAQFLPSCD